VLGVGMGVVVGLEKKKQESPKQRQNNQESENLSGRKNERKVVCATYVEERHRNVNMN
jgi:hypothetical protein